MPLFLPSRASPPTSPRRIARDKIPNLSSFDVTASSSTSSASAALMHLSSEDVQLIDDIILRAHPSATALSAVLKAYNEILEERGMDTANDLVYYKILLKIGVVKGCDWGTKWETVKTQMGYGQSSTSSRSKSTSTRGGTKPARSTPLQTQPSAISQKPSAPPSYSSHHALSAIARDSLTVHSHADASDNCTVTSDEEATETDCESSPATLIQRDRRSDFEKPVSHALPPFSRTSNFLPLPTIDQFIPIQAKQLKAKSQSSSQFFDEQESPPPTPRPFRTSANSKAVPRLPKATLPPRMHPPASTPAVAPKDDRSFDDEETWKKVRMLRDEREADRFREVMLLDQCWQVWKGGLDWIASMNEKVLKERGDSLLYKTVQKWKMRYDARLQDYNRIGQRHNMKILKFSLDLWRKKLQAKEVERWRADMRRKMALVKEKQDNRIRLAVWTTWKRHHHGEAAGMHFEEKLLAKSLTHWRKRINGLERLEAAAEDFLLNSERTEVKRVWGAWSKKTALYRSEKQLTRRVGVRLQISAYHEWRYRMAEHQETADFHAVHIVKNYFYAWKRRVANLRMMDRKADRWNSRQDTMLLRALMHVWSTRERGLLLERAMLTRKLQTAWMIWKSHAQNVRSLEDQAIAFRCRPSSAVTTNALTLWHRHSKMRRTLRGQAELYDSVHLVHRMMIIWRIQVRVKLRMAKHAKVARKYLLMRRTWNVWRDMLEEKRRQQKVLLFQNVMLRKCFEKWRTLAARRQYHRYALKTIETASSMRVLRIALFKWTNRVILLKGREFDIVCGRERAVLTSFLKKWKTASKRRADILRLMQSYQYVKGEEMLRRIFHRWLSAAKASRHRRLMLQEREDDVKAALMEKAWDAWREKFLAERLKPLELAFNLQLQNSRLYDAFFLWYSKTKVIPAIRFDATHSKARFWKTWRAAMPKALQGKEARKRYRNKLLAKALDKWAQAYRTKTALKAVARARYLRLPSGAPRKSLPVSSVLSGVLRYSRSTVSDLATRPPSPSEAHSVRSGYTGDIQRPSSVQSRQRKNFPLSSGIAPKPIDADSDIWYKLRRAHGKSSD